MSNEKLIAEIEKAAEEMIIEDTDTEEVVADVSAQSDEEKAAAEVASVDEAADAEVAATEKAAKEVADEEAAIAEKAGQEVAAAAIDKELLGRAVEVGVSVADARELPHETLEKIISMREAASEEIAREEIAREADARAAREQETAGTDKVEDPFADFPRLDPEVHDAEVIKSFEKMMAIAKAQHETIQSLQGRQEETSLATQARMAEEVERKFDKQIAELGEDFSEALGTGGYRSLSQGSSQYAKREAIANQMSVLFAGHTATGQPEPSFEEAFEVAAKLVLADEYQKIHERRLTGDLEAQASQHIQRAGGSKISSVQTPEDETAAMLNEKFG